MPRTALASLFFLSLITQVSWCAVPTKWEGLFTRASAAIQMGDWKSAETHLSSLRKALPEEPEVLELQALTYKSTDRLIDAKNTYLKLYKGTKVGDRNSKRGLYAFELGNVAYALKNKKRSEQFLKESISLDVNPNESHFILGKLAFEGNRWEESRHHFQKAVDSFQLKPTAHWYLAQVATKQNQISDAITSFVEAKESALSQLGQDTLVTASTQQLARQVLKNSETELRSYDQSSWMTQVGITSSYDSNVLYIPNATDAAQDSNLDSFKQSLNWQVQYASSPVRYFQYVGNYQGSINYNFNQETKGGQFFTHDLSHFITRGFLKTWSYGLKVAGSGIFQYQTDAYRPFSLTGTIGPFANWKLGRRGQLGAEAFFSPTKNYLDDSLPTNIHRSGWEQTVRVYWASKSNERLWSPSVFLSGVLMRPEGTEFRGRKLSLDGVNSMFLNRKVFLSQSVGLSGAWFSERELSSRSDTGLTGAVSAGYQWTDALALTAQVDYLRNLSSDPSFRYDRVGVNVSGNYRF
ncbi:hypothetical protein EBR78_04760 [bacterium]|nr:hypothetical protein [bacterium]